MENNKINVADLLKDCPPGMKLYSPIFGDVYLNKIRPHLGIVVTTDKEQGDFKEVFLYDGRYGMNGECMLFPSKDKTTWEGFELPIKFEDGEILVHTQNQRFVMSICHKRINEILLKTHCILWDRDEGLSVNQEICWYKDSIRLATEEEKQKLFDTIEENGYRWNSKTKTLDKPFEPKFKVGDRVKSKNHFAYKYTYTIKSIKSWGYILNDIYESGIGFDIQDEWELVSDDIYESGIGFDIQDEWELVSDDIKPKFKTGDRVVRKNGVGVPVLITKGGDEFYKTSNDDNSTVGVFRITDQDDYVLVLDKFDISILIPFETKVLVRYYENQIWIPAIFGGYIDKRKQYKYIVVGGLSYEYLIPYEGNEHLLGTTNDCDEYYKTWEK